MAETDRIEVRSYGLVFELERRLHKIDRWRVPAPYGVPLRGLAYFAACLVAVIVAEWLPLIGWALGGLHLSVRYILLPIGLAYWLTVTKVDGRPAHKAARVWVESHLRPRRIAAFRRASAPGTLASLGTIAFVPDESGPRYRRARLRGPARALLRYPAQVRRRGRALRIEQSSERPMLHAKTLRLAPSAKAVFR